jgi:hypothetical protein
MEENDENCKRLMLINKKCNKKSSEKCDDDDGMSYQHHPSSSEPINQKTTEHRNSDLKEAKNEYANIRLCLISVLNNHEELFRVLEYSVDSCGLRSHC